MDNPTMRDAFYRSIDKESLSALWVVLGDILQPEPRSACAPAHWNYQSIRRHLLEAGKLITAKEAERRVLILENPGLRGQTRITTSLFAGVQLVMPGEVAPAHRHSASALRLVLEANGGHTTVNGEKIVLHNGDFVITPNWSWHDHGNTTSDPIIWLDGLDIAIVSLLDAGFSEGFGDEAQPVIRADGDSNARYGTGMLPVDWKADALASPICNYPYERSREGLETLRRDSEWDPCHGLKMRYVNPADGGWAIPTMGTCLQLLPRDFQTISYRSTDATVFVPIEGSGSTTIDGMKFNWGPRDVFVVPSWREVVHSAREDAVLFSYSDRPVQEKLGLWRERRGNR